MEETKYIVTITGDRIEDLYKLSSEYKGDSIITETVLTFKLNSENLEKLKQELENNPYAYIIASSKYIEPKSDEPRDFKEVLADINKNDRFSDSDIDISDSNFFRSYMNLQEIDSSLNFYNTLYNDFTSIEKLPEKTHEGRECSLFRINKTDTDKTGLYITGGIHGNEWIPPEAVIYFIKCICFAFKNNDAVTLGKNKYSKEIVKTIIEKIDFYIFPLVNPDGRNLSQNRNEGDSMIGRKNRRFSSKKCYGVDINRNFDFVWNYEKYFSPVSSTGYISKEICHENYIGPYSFSEPETRNLASVIHKNYAGIEFYLDIHSKITKNNLVLYSWGHSATQSDYPALNFNNSGFWKLYGDRYYGEYVKIDDFEFRKKIAKEMAFAASKTHGFKKNYLACTTNEMYIMSGSSRDYMESLNFKNENFKNVHSFIIEASENEFNPSIVRRKNMISEITSSIMEICVQILKHKKYFADL